MAGDRSYEDLCRICISGSGDGDDTVSIYSDEGKSCGLEEKIVRFLSIQISEDDELPKVVCKSCRIKLDSMQNFCSLAAKSQETLMKLRCSDEAEISKEINNKKEDSAWWSFPEGEDESSDEQDKYDEKGDINSSSSLLHSILTKGQTILESDVTEMEVTVDPMLFFEEEDEDEEEHNSRPNDGIPGETTEQVSEPKPYQCYLCPRGFNSDLSLKSHLWNHIPSRRVLATSDLNGSRHEGETTIRTRIFNSGCLCQECGRVYPSKSTLRAHQITHSNLRPHKCSLCDKTFKRNQDLKFHINQHTGERPYRCPYCPKAFASSGNCFSHRKRMHPKQLARDKKKRR